jgi:hypothetical protein
MGDHLGHNIVICTYRVKKGAENDFFKLMVGHYPTLLDLGLVRDGFHQMYEGVDSSDGVFFNEIFEWTDAAAVETAHSHEKVQAIWGPMAELCEERGARPAMEFPHVRAL